MKIGVPKERLPGERRVAASPDTAKKLVGLGHEVVVEAGAGAGASFTDEQYREAGATVADGPEATVGQADLVLKVRPPLHGTEGGPDEVALFKEGAILIGLLAPYKDLAALKAYAARRVAAFSLDLLPRITRTQSMDALSSQANLAGYKAVLVAANALGRVFPMMMTAAGTIVAARVLVMGVGVAGLQAIATARRLGAIVFATDVRLATKEQVESLGGRFLVVDEEEMRSAETAGGYAREMSAEFQRKQAALILDTLRTTDAVILAAQIPGRPAPRLLTEEMVAQMKPGAVIVDLAVETGGNCALSKPDEVIEVHGVTIVGFENWPSRVATDASALYARNILHFLTPLLDKETGQFRFDKDEEVVKATLLTRDGAIVHPQFKDDKELNHARHS
ncbi:MAG TPA: Re/Si-specific NAD(P)(+) transhydrogenase subunit alpha [bacterium]|nr:Re/Si-specific NAD(P)(+) transhydrogenase subunit alpha [bacterium]